MTDQSDDQSVMTEERSYTAQSVFTAPRRTTTASTLTFCQCQCGDTTRGGRYLPGHDARHKSTLVKAAVNGCTESRTTLISLGWSRYLEGKATSQTKEKPPEKKEKGIPMCMCECGGVTRGGRFLPGHDAKHKSFLINAAIAGDITKVPIIESFGWGKFLAAKAKTGPAIPNPNKKVTVVTPAAPSLELTRIEVEPGDPRVMTAEQVLKVGMEVVQRACDWFMNTNRAHYAAVGFDDSDILGHLHENIFVKNFLPFFSKHPDYYLNGPVPGPDKPKALAAWKRAHYSVIRGTKTAEEIFKSSLFVSCRRCCFAHHRANIRSQKRGDGLRYGMVSLDHQDFNFEGHVQERSLFSAQTHDLHSGFEREIEQHLKTPVEQRIWICLYRNRPDILARLPVSANIRNAAIQKIRQLAYLHIDNPEPSKTSIMDPAVKARLKAAAQKALSTGAIKFDEANTPSVTQQLISRLPSLPEHKVREMIEFLDSGTLPIPSTPQQAKARAQSIQENVQAWLAVDYELVSEALDIEINNEMSPMVVKLVLSDRLQSLTIDERDKIPQFIWDFVQSMDVGTAPLNAQPDFDPYSVQIHDEETIRIIPLSSSVPSFMNRIRDRVKWVVWMEEQQVSVSHEDGCILIHCANFRFFTIDQIRKMLTSFDA